MTDPTPRASSSVAFRIAESFGTGLKSLIGGAILFIPGLIWFIDEIKDANGCDTPLHIGHVSFAVGLIAAGAVFINPPFGKQLTSIFVAVFPNGLPMFGGRRQNDPPLPPEDPSK